MMAVVIASPMYAGALGQAAVWMRLVWLAVVVAGLLTGAVWLLQRLVFWPMQDARRLKLLRQIRAARTSMLLAGLLGAYTVVMQWDCGWMWDWLCFMV